MYTVLVLALALGFILPVTTLAQTSAPPGGSSSNPAMHTDRPAVHGHHDHGKSSNDKSKQRSPRGSGFTRPGFGLLYTLGFGSTHTKQTSTHLNTELDFGWNASKWETSFGLRAAGSWLNGDANSEEYLAKSRADYLLTERGYLWGWAAYRYNRFNEYQPEFNSKVQRLTKLKC